MKKIRITRGGCGICYTDANGVKRHALKTRKAGLLSVATNRPTALFVWAWLSMPELPGSLHSRPTPNRSRPRNRSRR